MVSPQDTILKAAGTLKINIPTLCHLNGYEHITSCMLCVVHEINSDKLLPACSALVAENMRIETDNQKIKTARKDALDLLLSEHVGDCEAPCHRTCPAHMNIPLMIRQIREKKNSGCHCHGKTEYSFTCSAGPYLSCSLRKGLQP